MLSTIICFVRVGEGGRRGSRTKTSAHSSCLWPYKLKGSCTRWGSGQGERRECSMARGICALVKRVSFFSLSFFSVQLHLVLLTKLKMANDLRTSPALLAICTWGAKGVEVTLSPVCGCVGGEGGSLYISIECSLPFLLLPLLFSHPFGSWVHVALSWQNTNVKNKRKSWRQKRKGS